MPKFYFEIVDGYTIEDPQGMELPTEQQAKRIAEEMAKQIANDRVGWFSQRCRGRVCVKDHMKDEHWIELLKCPECGKTGLAELAENDAYEGHGNSVPAGMVLE